MEDKIKISILCQIYGALLTKKQLNILDDYYNMDLSLSEIAENNGITRQAVRDILKKGETRLFEYEEKLNIMKKMQKQEEKISIILSELTKIQTKSYNDVNVEYSSKKEQIELIYTVKTPDKLNPLKLSSELLKIGKLSNFTLSN